MRLLALGLIACSVCFYANVAKADDIDPKLLGLIEMAERFASSGAPRKQHPQLLDAHDEFFTETLFKVRAEIKLLKVLEPGQFSFFIKRRQLEKQWLRIANAYLILNEALVWYAARPLFHKFPGSEEDLLQEGRLLFFECLLTYKPHLVRFAAYFTKFSLQRLRYRMDGQLLASMRSARPARGWIDRVRRGLEIKLGHKVTDEEVYDSVEQSKDWDFAWRRKKWFEPFAELNVSRSSNGSNSEHATADDRVLPSIQFDEYDHEEADIEGRDSLEINLPDASDDEEILDESDELGTWDYDPRLEVEEADVSDALRKELRGIQARRRNYVELHFLEGLSGAEIARRDNISHSYPPIVIRQGIRDLQRRLRRCQDNFLD